MSMVSKLKTLANNPNVLHVIKGINNEKYRKLSFNEKADLFISFNDALNEVFKDDLILYINKKESEYAENRSVSVDVEESRLIINGVNQNPYICLKDLLLMHLTYHELDEYDYIEIGRVKYEENIVYHFPQLCMYSEINLKHVKTANEFIKSFLSPINQEYRKEYLKSLDNVITKKAINQIRQGYETLDSVLKRGVYDEMDEFSIKLAEMLLKENLSLDELSMLSLDDVLMCYIDNNAYSDEPTYAVDHINQFISKYFKAYSKHIKIELNDMGLHINGRVLFETEIFMDVLMQEIKVIEDNIHIIDTLISDDNLKKFNEKTKQEYNKLDCYFYSRLDYLDKNLQGKKLEILNYNKWTKIYRDSNRQRKSIYEDTYALFDDLINDEKFIGLVENYLNDKEDDNEPLFKIMEMMNKSYNADFQLFVRGDALVDGGLGVADNDSKIYINTENIGDKIAILATLFHEYRHLIQRKEVSTNGNLYQKELFKLMELQLHNTSCENEYKYAELESYGYINEVFYQMQPSEYDAELFAKKMLMRIQKKLKNTIKIDYDLYVSDNYSTSRYIDSEKYSIESYKNYIKVNEINELVDEEENKYKEIKKKIDGSNNYDDGVNIIKDTMFSNLKIQDKLDTFRLISNGEINIDYSKEKKQLTIGNRVFDTKKISDYNIIETIIMMRADQRIKAKKLRLVDRNKYVFYELSKYLPDEIDEFSFMSPYLYHSCLDKYYRIINKDKAKNNPYNKRRRK